MGMLHRCGHESSTMVCMDCYVEIDEKLAAAEARVRDLENRFCQSHRGDVKASHDCAYCGLYIDARAEGSES